MDTSNFIMDEGVDAELSVHEIGKGSYQRPLDFKYVKKLVKDGFKGASITRPHVGVFPDGTLHIIDGQHRLEAAKQLSISTIKVIIHKVSGEQECAYLFSLFDTHKNINTSDKQHAADIAGVVFNRQLGDFFRDAGFSEYKGKSGDCVGNYLADVQHYWPKKPNGDKYAKEALLLLRRFLGNEYTRGKGRVFQALWELCRLGMKKDLDCSITKKLKLYGTNRIKNELEKCGLLSRKGGRDEKKAASILADFFDKKFKENYDISVDNDKIKTYKI
jgi:hypothetical protein